MTEHPVGAVETEHWRRAYCYAIGRIDQYRHAPVPVTDSVDFANTAVELGVQMGGFNRLYEQMAARSHESERMMAALKSLREALAEVVAAIPGRPVSAEANAAWEKAKEDIARHDREFDATHPEAA